MSPRLRNFLLSTPVVTGAGLLALYLVCGFLVLPAVVKWQVEKQVPAKLGHPVSVAEVRFNPFTFRFEAGELVLSDPAGRPMAGFKRLLVDFELRSVIDRAWTFAQASLEAPMLRVEVGEDGRHNFSAMLERLRGNEPEAGGGALPRLVIQRVVLSDGRVEFSDRLLAEPVVAHVEPLRLEVEDLSTLPAREARFRLSARTAAGETLETGGTLALNPVATRGTLALNGVQVATLAGGLARVLALDAPAGQIDFAAGFDLAVDHSGTLSGGVKEITLDVTALSVTAPGGNAPLAAAETLSLRQGRIDLETREAAFAGLRLAKGGFAAAVDKQGNIDWMKLVRARTTPQQAAATPAPEAPGAVGPAPWRISVASADVSEIALRYADAASAQAANVAALDLTVAATAELGGSAGPKVELAKPRLSLSGVQLERGPDSLNVPTSVIEAGRAALVVAGSQFDVMLDAPRVAAPRGIAARQGDATLEVGDAVVHSGHAALVASEGRLDLVLETPRVAAAGGLAARQGDTALEVPDAALQSERVALVAAEGRFDVKVEAPRVAAAKGLAARQGDASLEIHDAAVQSGRIALGGADGKIKGAIADPGITVAGASIRAPGQSAQVREVSFGGKQLAVQSGTESFEVGFEQLRGALAALQMERGEASLELGSAAIENETLSLAQAGGRARVAGSGARLSASGVAARQGSERLAVQDASFDAQAMSVTAGAGAAVADIEAKLENAALELASVGVVAQSASSEVGRLSRGTLGAQSLAITLSGEPPDVSGTGLTAALSDALVRSPADASELLRLGSLTLSGGVLSAGERMVSVEKVALADGTARTVLDAQGRFNWLSLFGAAGSRAADASKAPAEAAEAPPERAPRPAWRVAVKSAALDGFAVGFEDRRASPAFAVGLEAMRARVTELDTASPAPMEVEFQAQVASGGEVRATGNVRAGDGTSDLEVAITGIALAPLQTYLSEFAELRLASGTVSSAGRLRYGEDSGAGARLAYEGSVAVDRLLLEETERKRPFLAWESVASADLVLTLAPNHVDIGELKVEQPSGRLIIAEDQSVNLMDVLKKPEPGGAAPEKPEPAPAAQREPREEAFPVTIARVRVSGGLLEFADLSLRPQFGTRMHGLKGVVTGLGTDPESSARLQLDARVDQYGSAKIRGQVSMRQPEKFTEVDMVFRNLEMTSLSPYVAKFAGYKIAGGRLDLDLQYKVRSSKLLGENNIVLRQIALGEKVESPDALDLPLELAIAILKDAEGVIDIGLPVSGDLNDPKFDYGAVIAKAFGNMVGGIVSAPFRALGAIFGGSEKKLGTIAFEPGTDELAPPERQKLEAIARALKERPALMLVVPPTYAAEEDAPVLKTLAVRTDIVRRMGVTLAPGEDPGPIDAANPRVQRAVEAVFSQRYPAEALAVLKRRAVAAAPPPGEAAQESPPADGGPAMAPAAKPAKQPRPPVAFYQGLVERLIDDEPVSEQKLAQLATRRGEAIVRELTTRGGVPPERVTVAEPRKAIDASENAVTLRLELEVAK